MTAAIKWEARSRGITRLCHFTLVRNFVHIATSPDGLLSREMLEAGQRPFGPTDDERWDRHRECICCNIEYPNLWYLARVKNQDLLFRDWVVLFLSPTYIWQPGTLFCARNAAAGAGSGIAPGLDAFRGMFAEEVLGAHGKVYRRFPEQLPCCPTDQQAEVLVPGKIPRSDILGFAVPSESRAKQEHARLELLSIPELSLGLVVAPALFNVDALSRAIREGRRPHETKWAVGGEDA